MYGPHICGGMSYSPCWAGGLVTPMPLIVTVISLKIYPLLEIGRPPYSRSAVVTMLSMATAVLNTQEMQQKLSRRLLSLIKIYRMADGQFSHSP